MATSKPGTLLPTQIPAQDVDFCYLDKDGRYIVDVNWYLFLYNLWKQVLGAAAGAVVFPPAVNIALIDAEVEATDIPQAYRQIANALADANLEIAATDALQAYQQNINTMLLALDDAISSFSISGAGMTQLTGDVIAGPGSGSQAATISTPFRTPTFNFRLTTQSGAPISFADRTAQTSLYLTPYKGNVATLWDGSAWTPISSAEVSAALGTLTNATNYDVYCYNNAGALTIDSFVAWKNSGQAISASTSGAPCKITSAGHGLATGDEVYIYGTFDPTIDNQVWTVTVLDGSNYDLNGSNSSTTTSGFGWMSGRDGTTKPTLTDGRLTKASDKKRLYVGTFRTTSTTGTEDSGGNTTTQVGGNRFVWNYYNRVRRDLAVFDSTASWAGAGTRQANGNAGNQCQVLIGIQEAMVVTRVMGIVFLTGAGTQASLMGMAINNTAAFDKNQRQWPAQDGSAVNAPYNIGSEFHMPLCPGMHSIKWMEIQGTSASIFFIGSSVGTNGNGRSAGMFVESES